MTDDIYNLIRETKDPKLHYYLIAAQVTDETIPIGIKNEILRQNGKGWY